VIPPRPAVICLTSHFPRLWLKRGLWLVLCCLSLGLGAEPVAPTAQSDPGELSDTQAIRAARLVEFEKSGVIPSEVLEQANLDAENSRLQSQNLQIEKTNAEQDVQEQQKMQTVLADKLEKLQKQPVTHEQKAAHALAIKAAETALAQQQVKLEQATRYLADTNDRYILSQRVLDENEAWYQQIQTLHQRLASDTLENRAQALRQKHLDKAAGLSAQLAQLPETEDDHGQSGWLEIQILDAEERAQLVLRQLRLTELEIKTQALQGIIYRNSQAPLALTTLREALSSSETLQSRISTMQTLLQDKLGVLTQQQRLLENRLDNSSLYGITRQTMQQGKQLLDALIGDLQKQQASLIKLQEPSAALVTQLTRETAAATRVNLLKRRYLPSTAAAWQALKQEILAIPTVFSTRLKAVLQTAREDLRRLAAGDWLALCVLSLLWLLGLTWGQVHLQQQLLRLSQTTHHNSHIEDNIWILLRLLRSNLPGIAVGGLLVLLVLIAQPADSTAFLILGLTGIWLGIRLPIDFAWELLVAPDGYPAYHNPALYRQLRWMLLWIGISSSVTVLIHVLPFSAQIRELNDSLYLLFLSLMVLPILQIRALGLQALQDKVSRHYWMWIMRITSLLVPLSILAIGLLGVIGYINLAWVVAKGLSWMILLLTGWLVLRGYLHDLVVVSKNYVLRRSPHYGLLWTQDIIPLFHKLLLIILSVFMVWLFLDVNGLRTDSGIIQTLLAYPLLSLGGSTIHSGGLLFSVLALLMVFWLGHWIRQITYRWIYLGVTDLGTRNSLSVFTQYAVVLIGLLISFNIMGLKLTTLTVFAGALGVGLGFGLQNIANNFVSGLLLLIERPIRTGDLVNIGGNYEGKVTRIGIRSLTVTTWNNQDVIVPNSELISQSFTNWTRSDTVLRTVLEIGVSYEADPVVVQNVLLQVLEAQPNVLKEPVYRVLLENFADSAVLFRAYYFVNIGCNDAAQVKSAVLFAIWAAFKTAGIEIPYPQRDIHIRNTPPASTPLLKGERVFG